MMASAAVLWIYCFWGNISTQPRMWYHRNTKANPFVGGTRLLSQKTWAQGFPITLVDFLGLPDNPRLFHPTLSHFVLSVQFSDSVVSDSLWLHEPQHARPPCPSPTPKVHPNPCPFSQWCHPAISSSVVPISSCPQSFPASGSFQMSRLFASGGQSIGVSASASVFPMNIQDWFPLGWTGWIVES